MQNMPWMKLGNPIGLASLNTPFRVVVALFVCLTYLLHGEKSQF